jgi:hypothetical protein
MFKKVILNAGYRNERHFISEMKKEEARTYLLKIMTMGSLDIDILSELKGKFDNQLRSADYIEIPFEKSKVTVSKEEIQKYYDEHKDSYKNSKLYDVNVLLLKYDTENEDSFLDKLDIVDDLLTSDNVSLKEIAGETEAKIIKLTDVNPSDREMSVEGLDPILMPEILGQLMEMEMDEKTMSEIKQANNNDYFIVEIEKVKGGEYKQLTEVKDEITKKIIEEKAQENAREKAVEFVKQINEDKKSLKDFAFPIKKVENFHRMPSIAELKVLSPIASANLFSKEKVGDAGLAMLTDSMMVFVLTDISTDVKAKEAQPINLTNTLIECFTNSLLGKYKAKVNYDAIDKLYKVE